MRAKLGGRGRWVFDGRRAGAAALAFLIVAGFAGCADQDRRGPTGEARQGGTAVVGMRTDFGGFNPIVTSDAYGVEINNYALFTPLVTYDANLDVQPHLADSWQEEGDSAVVFNLRRDVRWHDGQPVTAEDVKFTFDLAKDPAAAALLASAFLADVAEAQVIDPYTIRFRYERPHAQALENFWWAPAPRHLLEGVAAGDLRNAPYNRQPVGSGPFRFVEWRENDRLVLQRNDEYPQGLGGPPNLDRVVFRIIPEPATMLTELLTGGVDYDVPLTPEQTREVEGNPDIELLSGPGRTFYYIGWNNRRAPFTSPRVRRAMTLAIDRQQIIDAMLFGHGRPATGPIPPWSPLYPGLDPLRHDADEARRLLEAEGWRPGADGVLRGPGGRPFSFTLLTSDHPVNRAVVEVVQAQLRRIGVDARIQVLEFQTVLAQHRGRDFDAVFANWVLDNFQVASAPMALFHSSLAAVPNSPNRSGVASPRLDALIERGAAATERGEAQRTWREFLEAVQEEQPFTSMFWLDELAAARSRLQGVELDARGELVSIREWWLEGGRR
jgi:peptide/nickel transport system substrate-binding protein